MDAMAPLNKLHLSDDFIIASLFVYPNIYLVTIFIDKYPL